MSVIAPSAVAPPAPVPVPVAVAVQVPVPVPVRGLSTTQILAIGAAVLTVAGSAYAVYAVVKSKTKAAEGQTAEGAAAAASPTLLARPRGAAVVDLPPDVPVPLATTPLKALLMWKPDPKKFGGFSVSTTPTKVPPGWTSDASFLGDAAGMFAKGFAMVFQRDAAGAVLYFGRNFAKMAYTGVVRQGQGMARGNMPPKTTPTDLALYALALGSIARTYPFNPYRRQRIQEIADSLVKAAGGAAQTLGVEWVAVGPSTLDTFWAYPSMSEYSPKQRERLYSVGQSPGVVLRRSGATLATRRLRDAVHPGIVAYFTDRAKSEKGFPEYVAVMGWNDKWYLLRKDEPDKAKMLYRLESLQRKIEMMLVALLKVFGAEDVRYRRLTETVLSVVAPDVAAAVQMENDGLIAGGRVGGYVTANRYEEIAPSGLSKVPKELHGLNVGLMFMNVADTGSELGHGRSAKDTALYENDVVEGIFETFVHEVTHLSSAAARHNQAFFEGWRAMCHLAYLCGAWTGPGAPANCSDNPGTYGDWVPFFDADWWNCNVPRLKKYGDRIP